MEDFGGAGALEGCSYLGRGHGHFKGMRYRYCSSRGASIPVGKQRSAIGRYMEFLFRWHFWQGGHLHV